MRLLIATGIFPPETGGPATYSRMLATELTRRGHFVRVVTYSGPQRVSDGYVFPVTRVKRSSQKVLHYLKYAAAAVWYGLFADVLFAQDPVSAGLPTLWASRILRKPLLLKVVGDYAWEQGMQRFGVTELLDEFLAGHHSGAVERFRSIQKNVAARADRIIVPSQYLKFVVEQWGVAGEKITVIPNAVEVPEDMPSRTAAREKLGLKRNDFLILSAGREVPWKGFALLREAVVELSREHKNMKLLILSKAPREELLSAMRAADAFVLNTGYEGFPHTIVEAMAVGCPVATTRSGGNPEIVKHPSASSGQANGLLFSYNSKDELKETIMCLYNDSVLRKRLAEEGAKTSSQYTVECMVNETERTLENV